MTSEILVSAKELNEYAKKEIESEILAKFALQNITHARVGGYNARVVSPKIDFKETIRTTSIKGVWRWWLRVVLAGAYCDAGCQLNVREIETTTKRMLGSTSQQSSYVLKLVPPKNSAPAVLKDDSIPRLKLLTRGITNDQEKDSILKIYPPGALNFELSITKKRVLNQFTRTGPNKLTAASNIVSVGSLCLALFLGGLGSISRRGFGHFQINFTDVRGDITELRNKLVTLYRNPTNENFESLRSYVVESAIQVLGLEPKRTPVNRELLSEVPSLCKTHFRAEVHPVKLRGSYQGDRSSVEQLLLRKIGKSVLKSVWKMNDPNLQGRMPKAGQSVKEEPYQTWILGLPRQASSHGVITGYFVPNKEVSRRISAISFAPIKKEGESNYVLVFGFKSGDWPSISHNSYGNVSLNPRRKEPITHSVFQPERKEEHKVSAAFDSAFRTICLYLESNQN